jgi:hypothetical protein
MKFYGARLPLAFALIVLSVCSAQASRTTYGIVLTIIAGSAASGALRPVVWKTACAGMATN